MSSGLSQKLKRAASKPAGKKSAEENDDPSKSPYFSPRKTRNKIKIEYEKPSTVPPKKKSLTDKIPAETKKEISPKNSTKRSSTSQEEHSDKADIKNSKWEPANWQEIIANLKIMRKSIPAPVDTMGCHKCSDESADEKTQRFHKLIALMLSSQTKDQVTFDAMNRLKSRGLTPQNVITWKASELEDILKPVSFYKNKARFIQKTAQILIDQYDGDIPNTPENLMKLPGVGPKMAHICMNTAWNVISGIGVDVHVHRICNRLKWVRKPTKQPEDTRVDLESWLPSEHWSEVNALLVGFGQTICAPINPKCEICLNNQICPSATLSKSKNSAK